MEETRIIQEIDVIAILGAVGKKAKKHQAKVLQEVEKYMDRNSEDYKELRKFFLDEQNSFTRSVMRDIFGDIEFMMKN